MKLKYLLVLYIGLVIFLSFHGSAVECNVDLSQGGDSCTVSSSLLGGCYEI